MRISDWSSDVCPSDLPRHRDPSATHWVRRRGRLREGAESYAKDLGQRYSPVRLMCSHPNGETWASRSGAIWVPLAARVLTTSPSFMVFQNMMMAASRFIPRSEEHTSELQSLMRSSYAAFCLKTKKSKDSKQQIVRQIRLS